MCYVEEYVQVKMRWWIMQAYNTYNEIKRAVIGYPNTKFVEPDLYIDAKKLACFAENVPGQRLEEFANANSSQIPGPVDFLHVMIALKNKCEKFVTRDTGILLLNSYEQTESMEIISPDDQG